MLTVGQKLAKAGAGDNLNVKVEKKVDAFGVALSDAQKLPLNKEIKQLKFIEVHGNGNGIYVSGGIK